MVILAYSLDQNYVDANGCLWKYLNQLTKSL